MPTSSLQRTRRRILRMKEVANSTVPVEQLNQRESVASLAAALAGVEEVVHVVHCMRQVRDIADAEWAKRCPPARSMGRPGADTERDRLRLGFDAAGTPLALQASISEVEGMGPQGRGDHRFEDADDVRGASAQHTEPACDDSRPPCRQRCPCCDHRVKHSPGDACGLPAAEPLALQIMST